MYSISDYVFHNGRGICQIQDIRTENFTGKPQEYYVLHPIYDKPDSTLYIATESGDASLQDVYTKEEIDEAIRQSLDVQLEWIEHNSKRKTYFTELLRNGTTPESIALIRFINRRKRELEEAGKRLIATDERILSELHRKVDRSLAFCLGIEEADVHEYVVSVSSAFAK